MMTLSIINLILVVSKFTHRVSGAYLPMKKKKEKCCMYKSLSGNKHVSLQSCSKLLHVRNNHPFDFHLQSESFEMKDLFNGSLFTWRTRAQGLYGVIIYTIYRAIKLDGTEDYFLLYYYNKRRKTTYT